MRAETSRGLRGDRAEGGYDRESLARRSRLLTATDLAERWQVPASVVYRLTRAGALPAVRLGRYYRYRLDTIEAWEVAGGVGENASMRHDP